MGSMSLQAASQLQKAWSTSHQVTLLQLLIQLSTAGWPGTKVALADDKGSIVCRSWHPLVEPLSLYVLLMENAYYAKN